MGKKTKVGKQRKDKYYRLAKEAGYRSRASFKLMQLNKRFEFLQNSRALVDLCAAPGGWLQVATQNMPMSSICIGIDLVPIRPIKNCIILQGDITTEKTRQMIKKELLGWQADCVLHDGAPNVGLNWLQDAFQQNQLTLSALRLATVVLAKNGWFVTKIFRSKDYDALIRVFEKLFKRVHVWKPAASRLESAEIFVVCEKYLKPTKVDASLLDTKTVFKEANLDPTPPKPQDLLQVRKKEKKQKAEGYAEGQTMLYLPLNASEFVASKQYLDLLSTASEVVLDESGMEESEHTTEEVRECLKDIKVCGPRELRTILAWRRKIRVDKEKEQGEEKEGEEEEDQEAQLLTPEQIEAEEIVEIDKEIANAKADEKANLKRKKRKLLKERSKERKKKQLKMVIEGDVPDLPSQPDLFALKQLSQVKQFDAVLDVPVSDRPQTKQEEGQDDDEDQSMSDEESDEDEIEEMDEDEEDTEDHPLLVTEETGMDREEKLRQRAHLWFSREGLTDLLDEDEDLTAVEKHIERLRKRTTIPDTVADAQPTVSDTSSDTKTDKKPEAKERENKGEEEEKGTFEEELEQSDSSEDDDDLTAAKRDVSPRKKTAKDDEGGMEIVPQNGQPKRTKRRRLDPELLALGEQMIYSSKSRRDLEDWGWNRYTNNDDGLPDWFVDDEKRHYRKELPITKAQVEEYKRRQKELNAKPIKKVAEAKMRKRKQQLSKLNRAKKKAEGIVDNPEMQSQEKIREMKKVYKKATSNNRELTYQVMSKGKRGKLAAPKGPYKVVDRRLKKDNRKGKQESRKKQWKAKSTAAKMAEQEKSKKKRTAKKGDRRTNRRTRRGKPV